jgi:hypothetical protein
VGKSDFDGGGEGGAMSASTEAETFHAIPLEIGYVAYKKMSSTIIAARQLGKFVIHPLP